ncbi:MAG: magnesium/cobalt transporter CorA [Prolixibacteraceae bacterium]|jgi:magnesium transporter|nr:magnesium/cobalt transporter CorA [Prolixibacteraceae bacterium]
MARFLKSRKNLVGQAPGAMTFIGRKKMEKPRFRIMSYDEKNFREKETVDAASMLTHLQKNAVNWINIDGLHDHKEIMEVGMAFNLSPLVLEDIVNTDQRPKVIEDDDNLVVFLKQLTYEASDHSVHADQITLILGENYVISFQEEVGAFFNTIRERMRQNVGKIRTSNSDYLFYRIIDTIADNYMLCIGAIGELVEENETNILKNVNKEIIGKIYNHKQEISFIRKAVRPAKDVTKSLKNAESKLIHESTRPYINDLDDILIHSMETIEIYYTMIGDQLNLYNTNLSNRANDVMKVLTIFAAIFIPLTFIAGIYGTNFDNVPELHYKYSYFIMWGVMVTLAIVMLLYFRRKKWL